MGFFDRFRSKSPADAMQDEMRRLAPVLFPGGHEQIQSAGRSIAGLLDNRIPADSASKLFASTKYLAHTAKDKSKTRVVEYIVRQGMGRISQDEASVIYDRFIISTATNPNIQPAAEATAGSDAMYINDDLAGRTYWLRNRFQSVEVDAMMFTVVLLGLKSQGWQGAPQLFTPDGSSMKPLSGTYEVSDLHARELAIALQGLVTGNGIDSDMEELVAPLIAIASEGAFTIQA